MEQQLEAAVKAAGGTVTATDVPDLPLELVETFLGSIAGGGLMGGMGGFAAGPLGRIAGPSNVPTRRQVLIAFANASAVVAFVNKAGDVLVEYLKSRAEQETVIEAGGITVKLHGPHDVKQAEAAFRAAAAAIARGR